MKILKRILLVIIILVAIVLIAGLFVKKDFNVEREVTINKPKQQVFEYVKYVKNQDNFSKWNMLDPGRKKTYSGTDGTVGFAYSWESQNKNVGQGEQRIKGIKEGERMDFGLHFLKPFESNADAYMTTEAAGDNATKVKWGFAGKMPYPMNVMGLFMNMDKAVGDDLQTGLNNLKTLMEKQ
jgi:uncharacterized protein YndB with AHSA1/START domain